MVTLTDYLVLGAVLFALGMFGIFINRKNMIILLMSVELLINAANINLVAFSRSNALDPATGQIFAVFVIAMAAAAAAVGLAIVLALFRVKKSVWTDDINLLKW